MCIFLKESVMTDIKPMSQVDAVYAAAVETLIDNGVFFVEGETVIHDVITSEIRATIRGKVAGMLLAGTVSFSKPEKLQDEKFLKTYVSGLVTNWFNKDKRLNAGASYQAKAPGSKSDDQIKAMRQLQALKPADSEDFATIQAAIDARLAELADAKKATKGSTLESVQEEMAG
jgi:hypothetical protein